MFNPVQKYKQSQQEASNKALLEYCSSNYSVSYTRRARSTMARISLHTLTENPD